METNNITSNVPGLNLLPVNWQGPIAILIAASPFITRAVYALRNNGGIRGVFASIWLGTNTPKVQEQPKQ